MDELANSATDRQANLSLGPGRRVSTDALTQHVALVPETSEVNYSELARVGAALQKQVTRDLGPVWGISATVSAFPHLEDVPVGYWPIIVTLRDLGSEAGVHMDKHGQPFALVELSPSWSLAASHECLNMLISPYGNRTVAGASPRADQWEVEFLVQICDPCGDARYAYSINDVLVSDFCTPMYFEPITGGQGSFTRAIESPFEVLPGGYLCWYDPITDTWWMRSHFGEELTDMNLGPIDCKVGTMREVINTLAPGRRDSTKMTIEAFEARMGVARQRAMYASQYQAHRLRSAVAAVGNVALPSGHRVSGLPQGIDRASGLPPGMGGDPGLTSTLPGADMHARVALQHIEDASAPTMAAPPTPKGFATDPPRRATLPAPGLHMRVDGMPGAPPIDTTTQRMASYPSPPSGRPARRSTPPPPLPQPAPTYVESMPAPVSSMAPVATPSSRPQPPMRRWASGSTLFAAGLLAVLFGGAGVVAYDNATSERASATASQSMGQLPLLQPVTEPHTAAASQAVAGANQAIAVQPNPLPPSPPTTVVVNGPAAPSTAAPPFAPVAAPVEGIKPSTLPLVPPPSGLGPGQTTAPGAAPAHPGAAAVPLRGRVASSLAAQPPVTVASASAPIATPAAAQSAAARPADTHSDDPVDGLIGQRR